MSVLRQRMKEDMKIRGLAPSTQQAYEKAVERLAMHYNKRPDLLSSRDIQTFLLYLHEKQGLSWGTCNTFVNGLRFCYHTTLGRTETSFHIPCPKPPKKLPVVLSRQEVIEIFAATTSLRDSALLKTTYSAGLRVTETINLKGTDIDSRRMCIRVEQGKGQKDRSTLLSNRLLKELRTYWKVYQPEVWLFPDQERSDHISRMTAWRIFHRAKDKAGVSKPWGIHGFRHAFATHLLEAGHDPHTIQRLLGHTNIRTTLNYFHLARRHLLDTTSPLDSLDDPRLWD
jgi:integrase/recombinase XerD